MGKSPELWRATYKAATPEELAEAYRKWAPFYDDDTRQAMGYVGPVVAGKMLDSYLESKESRILDAGCGTGLVGEVLKDMGYQHIEAMDFSDDMLGEAEKKDVYCNAFQADMNTSLEVPDDTYDASICVGTFTYAHVGPQAFEELARITKPGGYICFTVRDGAYEKYGYRGKMLDLESEESWELQEMYNEHYLIKEEVKAKFCTYRVL